MTHPLTRAAGRIPILLAMICIRAYQVAVRPFLVGACKFYPTCSEYAIEALDRHGLIKGGWLSAKRIVRCIPGRGGGYDPVPGASASASTPSGDS